MFLAQTVFIVVFQVTKYMQSLIIVHCLYTCTLQFYYTGKSLFKLPIFMFIHKTVHMGFLIIILLSFCNT